MALTSREAYRDELTKLAKKIDTILCLETDLSGHNHPFKKAYPERFLNLGISELATLDIAAGLAESGFIPFYSTFAGFVALRAAESVKLNLGYMQKNIKLVCPYSGVSGAFFGTTHHCLEDLAIIQSMPGIKIIAPYGEEETRMAIRRCAMDPAPYYIRMGRNARYESFKTVSEKYPSESGIIVEKILGSKICLISIGEEGTRLCLEYGLRKKNHIDHIHLTQLHHEALTNAFDLLCCEYSTFVIVEETRPQGSIASTIALKYGRDVQVVGFNCGSDWLNTGGNHQECLAKLGFTVTQLENILLTLSG